MSTNNKPSLLIQNQFPDFVVDEGPVLIEFVKAYYQWMEQSGNTLERTNSLLSLRDIDDTEDAYIQWFQKEVLPTVPRKLITNKKLFAKRVLDLYRSRGSESSYRLLFRALFDEEIEFYYPGDYLLRASDGRWEVKNSLRVGDPQTGTLSDLSGTFITGVVSGASARVEQIVNSAEQGVIVKELFITSIAGEFAEGELITNVANTINATLINSTGPVSDVTIVDGGALHFTGDSVNIVQAGGAAAVGTVTGTTDQSAVEWSIANGGFGFTIGATITITHGVGAGAAFTIDTISATELIAVNDDLLSSMLLVDINAGITFVTPGANTTAVSANMAAANQSTPLSAAFHTTNATVGTINSITTTAYGSGYSTIPTVIVRQDDIYALNILDTVTPTAGRKGGDASIIASRVSGTIEDISVPFNTRGSGYSPIVIASLVNTSRTGTVNASGYPQVTGIVTYPGRYRDTHGFLSWDHKLQDNYYYQEYSYDIRSQQSLATYKSGIQKTIHPAGIKMFGTVVSVHASNTVPLTGTVKIPERYVWRLGQGNLNIANTGKSANGQGTYFGNTGDITNTSIIMISGGYYTVNVHTSNAAFTLDSTYEGPDHANVIYYILSNTEVISDA